MLVSLSLANGEVTFVHDTEWASARWKGTRIEFMGVDEYEPPMWPEDSALIHLDFFVDDLEIQAEHLRSLGAQRFEFQPNEAHCLVFTDPGGHPFCLLLLDDVGAG